MPAWLETLYANCQDTAATAQICQYVWYVLCGTGKERNSQNGSSLNGEKRQDSYLDLEDERKCREWDGERTR